MKRKIKNLVQELHVETAQAERDTLKQVQYLELEAYYNVETAQAERDTLKLVYGPGTVDIPAESKPLRQSGIH